MQRTTTPALRAPVSPSGLLLLASLILATAAPLVAQEDGIASAATAGVRAADASTAPEETAGGAELGSSRARRRPGGAAKARGGATSAARHTSPRSVLALARDLGAMLRSHVRSGRWGVVVLSLTRGDTLYSQDADSMLQPASNMKLFTTALALEQFGPQHRFRTDVLREGVITQDGTLHGNLILRGGGDPALASRYVRDSASASLDRLAQQVAAAGIRRVRGSVVADANAFDAQRIPEGWQSRYLAAAYAARVSALTLSDNVVWVVVAPGRSTNPTARITLEPDSDIPVSGRVRTVVGNRGARVAARMTPGGHIQVSGWIGSRAGERRYGLVVEDPATFAAGAFRRALAARGVTVEAGTRSGRSPAHAVLVTSVLSPPMERLLSVMNRESVNHYAELIFRNSARARAYGQVGSAAAANRQLQQFLAEKAAAVPGSVHAADGSGLSTLDRSTARALVQLLAYAHRAPWADAFHASLPVAGESETLRHRMRHTPAQGNLHAKTGTTNSVISLGGYVTARNGELLAFAFVYNGTDRWNARKTIDQMGATLAAFDRS